MNTQLEAYTKAKIGDYVVPISEAIDPNRKKGDSFSTGIEFLDDAMEKHGKRGFKDGDLMVVSGKSGHGKTTFCLNLIKNMMDRGVLPIIFSYEVIIDNVYDALRDMGVEECPPIFTPKKNVTGDIEWVKEKIRESDQKFMTKVVLIDHLDFLTAKGIKSDDHRRNEIQNIISDLKQFAIDEKKVIILISHIIKTRDTKLANEDIADSRAAVNIPDYIMFIGREINSEGVAIGSTGIAKLTKNRFTGKHTMIKFEIFKGLITSYQLCDTKETT